MTVQPSTPRRRWFAFSLRTLFVVVTVVAAPCIWVAHQQRLVAQRKELLAGMRSRDIYYGMHSGTLTSPPPVPWSRRLLGDEGVEAVDLPASSEAELRPLLESLFPETEIEVISDQRLEEIREHYRRLDEQLLGIKKTVPATQADRP